MLVCQQPVKMCHLLSGGLYISSCTGLLLLVLGPVSSSIRWRFVTTLHSVCACPRAWVPAACKDVSSGGLYNYKRGFVTTLYIVCVLVYWPSCLDVCVIFRWPLYKLMYLQGFVLVYWPLCLDGCAQQYQVASSCTLQECYSLVTTWCVCVFVHMLVAFCQ